MSIRTFSAVFLLSFFLLACQPQPIVLSGDLLFEDDFSTGQNGWTSLYNDSGVMGYNAGGFRFYVRDPDLDYWSTLEKHFSDVRIEVKALKYTGPVENRVGLICRYQNDQNYYFFVISTDGYYAIGKMKDGEKILLGQETMGYASAIRQGSEINYLRAECQRSTLRLYVNDTLIALTEDADFPEGRVGLLAGTFEEGGLDLLFDDFVVFQP